MNLSLKVVVLMSASVAALTPGSAGSRDRNRMIAQSDIGRVLYGMIACNDPSASATDCHAREQQRLARRLREQWIVAAAKANAVALTADEQAIVQRRVAAEEDHFAAAGAHFHALAVAALDVRRGKDRTRVQPELSKLGISAQELEQELMHLPSVADAERAAATDYVAASRNSAREAGARIYVLQHLRAIVSERSTAERVSFDRAEEAFWLEIAQVTHTRIIDPAFSMPERKGILARP